VRAGAAPGARAVAADGARKVEVGDERAVVLQRRRQRNSAGIADRIPAQIDDAHRRVATALHDGVGDGLGADRTNVVGLEPKVFDVRVWARSAAAGAG